MSTREQIEAAELARLSLFKGVAEADLAPLAAASCRRHLNDGETLVEAGEPISEVHWLERGQLALRVCHDGFWCPPSTSATFSAGRRCGKIPQPSPAPEPSARRS
jgi:hypothetical protein